VSYFTSIATGFQSLLTGLGITARRIRHKNVTLQYPHEKPELSKAYRSLISLVQFDELETHDCVACMQCVKICPSFCIEIEGGKVEGIKRKRASKFEVDFALCSLCGLCVDVCPTDTLEYSKLYDEADNRRDWVFDLLDPFRDFEAEFVEKQRISDAKEAEAKAAKKAAALKAKAEKEAADAAAAAKAAPAENPTDASAAPTSPAEKTTNADAPGDDADQGATP
jgi:formate hydrogenlyase subunit 6/NADH:ubiquinone oxidoreductase subunit I